MYTLLFYLSVLFAHCCLAIPRDYLYDHFDAAVLPKGDDLSEEVHLVVPIIYYGTTFKTIYVNSNGILSFQTDIPQFFNSEFPLDYPIIAPLYSNPTSVFLVTWEDVGYHQNRSDKVNTFQVALISSKDDTYVEFLYPENGIQWIQGTGDGSGLPDARAQAGIISPDGRYHLLGTGDGSGLPDARAQAGIISPDGRYHLLPGSGTDRVHLLEKWSNIDLPGMWLFRVGIVFDENDVEVPDVGVNGQDFTLPKTCAQTSTQCHSNAKCVDFDDGICCQCNNNYYGNGKFCVKNDVPIRVNGKVRGEVNGVQFHSLDLQCYVVMKDARTYTAISKMPIELGFSTQIFQFLGSTIGWIFAKPLADALNGFQITGGVFNQTIELTSINTGHSLTIKQNYLGLDVFDRLRVEVELDGTIPTLPENTNATISEYQEQYSVTGLGVIQSLSTRVLRYNDSYNNQVELPLKIKQDILYDYCRHITPQIGVTWKLKVGKNFISYEAREQIIRFGLSNKVGPLDDIDPCEEGRLTCVENSSCVIDGDSFKCVCNPGFYEIESDNQVYCTDINECQRGQHNCNFNAICINEPGTYRCECKSDFVGDGRICTPATSCASITCPENAQCVQTDIAKCECQPGFVSTGQSCVAVQGHNCYYSNNCSPFGYCALNPNHEHTCYCLPEYRGDGYTCVKASELPPTTTPEEVIPDTTLPPTTTTTEAVTELPPYEENKEPTAQPERVEESCIFGQCWCPKGYEKIPDSIYCQVASQKLEPGEEDSCNVLKNCDIRADCLFTISGSYVCVCKPGYKGDGYTCDIVEESCLDTNICDVHASCQYDEFARPVCICGTGFQGDGLTCMPIAACIKDEDCPINEECSFDQHTQTYECLCKEGTSRDSQHQCVAMDDTCSGGYCVENAECLYDPDFQTHYCACKPNFTGDGITECKPKPLGCDVLKNCGLNANCNYNITISLHQCQCASGYTGDGFVCEKERDCHIDPYMPGYIGNGTFCKEIPKYGGNFLLLNQGMATLKVPYNLSRTSRPRPIQVQMQQIAVGLDSDCLDGRFYWSDIFSRAIKSANYNGTEKKDFITYGVGSPEGISIDWVSRNIYWTDSTNKTIEVANIETRLTRTLITANLVNPRGIAVHPQRGKIFWSDWDRKNPKIEMANADGSDRQIFLNGTAVGLPNSLTIDFDTEHLCYADAGTKSIQCVDIDTRIIRSIAKNCSYPFGIATTRDRIYWSDWLTKKIEQVDKTTLERLTPMIIPMGGGSNKLYEVVAVGERCPSLINVCQYHREQCTVGHIWSL
ncbi:Calcium-binding EGF domain [Popillia japonica]|uniref:Calcium-binding EGF domain n=1 Tax=Popillia japonica TaxID=7064 RepID=A0AAW1LUL0_POPJA